MQYVILNGEYPFDVVLDIVTAPRDEPEKALRAAKLMFQHSTQIGHRHPAVEPLNGEIQ